jgi:anti-sigma factor RsiW
MNHPHEDDLLLLAYGELDPAAAAELERHLTTCATCREQLIRLERGRAALEWATPATPRVRRWAALGILAAAAAVAGIMLAGWPRPDDRPASREWPRPLEWSTTAGYIAGGPSVVEIDAQLTRLEQERYHALP